MSAPAVSIGLDARPLQRGFKAHAGRGTGRYTDQLVSELLRLSEREQLPFSVHLLEPPAPRSIDTKLHGVLPLGKRTFESQVLYPRQVAQTGVDAMHFFHHGDAPSRPRLPQFVTVLDLIPLIFPELYRAAKSNLRFRFARFLEYQAIAKASGLFAISEATKRDVMRILDVDADRIVVTPLAAAAHFQASTSCELPSVLLERLQGRPYLLYVGGIDPRKNVPFLIDVLGEFRRRGNEQIHLVLAGSIAEDDQYPRLAQAIARNDLQSQVIELGRVSDAALVGLYQNASAFVFPSLYEGFGLPVLEAMSCGTPVIAGANSSIPEVVGAAAVLVPDADGRAWLEAIESVWGSKERRAELRASGLMRARQFSWEETAKRTAAGYQEFLGRMGKVEPKNSAQVAKRGQYVR